MRRTPCPGQHEVLITRICQRKPCKRAVTELTVSTIKASWQHIAAAAPAMEGLGAYDLFCSQCIATFVLSVRNFVNNALSLERPCRTMTHSYVCHGPMSRC